MSGEADLQGLVGQIYDAALDPGLWPTVLQQAAALVNCPSGVLGYQDFSGQELSFIDSVGRDPAYWKSYNEHFFQVSPYVGMMKGSNAARSYATQELLSDAELMRTEFYHDWLRPQDIHYHAGAVLLRTPHAAALVEFQTSKRRGPFSRTARRTIDLLAPHFRRAIGIAQRFDSLRAEHAATLESLQQMDTAVLLLDEQGRPVFANRAAEIVMRRNPGLRVTARGLHAAHPAVDAQLQRLILGALRTGRGTGIGAGGSLLLRREEGPVPLILTVCPLGRERPALALSQGRIVAAMFLSRRPVSRGLAQMFRHLFGLTAAEARVAMALLNGDNAEDVAQRLRVGRETVRSQIKAVYGKTGVKRQGQLIRLALTTPAAPPSPHED